MTSNARKARSKRTTNGQRDPKGRFQPGNKAGSGHGRPKAGPYAEALREAVSVERAQRIFNRLADLAEEGDVGAAKLLLSYAIGKPRAAPPEAVNIDLPEISTAANCVEATASILKAVGQGMLTTDDASRMAAVVELGRRAIELTDIEQRLAVVEQQGRHR